MKKFLPILATALVGCSSLNTKTIQLSEARTPNQVSEVKLCAGLPPTNAVLMASIYATWEPSWWSWAYTPETEPPAQAAQAVLKVKAAARGANALKVIPWNSSPYVASFGYSFEVEGDAYFVP